MNRRPARFLMPVIVAAALAGCAAKSAAPTFEACEPVNVVSYNIRVGIGLDGKWSGHDPSENLAAIAAFFAEQKADVVLLQEVDRLQKRTARVDEVEKLAGMTGMHAAYAPAMVDGESQYGIALLSRWPIESFDAVDLPKVDYTKTVPDLPAYYSEQRMALVARIDAPAGPMTAICTHLGLTKDQRLAQIEALAGIVREERRAGRAVVLGGDFNAEPDASELAPVRAIMRDVYLDHRSKHGLPEDMTVRSRHTFPSNAPDRCIDYVFVDADAFRVDAVAIPPVTLSDHLPVAVGLCMERAD